jgi:hypothetical protein
LRLAGIIVMHTSIWRKVTSTGEEMVPRGHGGLFGGHGLNITSGHGFLWLPTSKLQHRARWSLSHA